jgi:deoxyribodipyrimidine photo-lyase
MLSMAAPIIIWYRRDLRIIDHGALRLAAESDRPVVPVYIADPKTRSWADGAASRWWLHHSLARLASGLAELGAPLVIRRGEPELELAAVCAETGADEVRWHRLYEPDARDTEDAVEAALHERGIRTERHSGALLHEPAALLKQDGTPYRVFTPFWRALSAGLAPPRPQPAPMRLVPPARQAASLHLDQLALAPAQPWHAGLADSWTPGEHGALRCLERFAPRVEGYPEARDTPASDGVSRLSPHLHFGEVTPAQVWYAVQGADAYIRQLGWREFAHSILFHFPHTTDAPMDPRFRDFPWRDDHEHLLAAWKSGHTGYPLVDAGMRELWHTGWMHNRVRMVAASLLVKNLRIPWQVGARWFWDTLVDADLANNTMGWQWVAGCGVDAAPFFRVFNPARQQERFDPAETYIRRWLPEWGTGDYPAPVVDFRASRDAALEALKRMKDGA